MSHKKHALKILGLAVMAALALSVFTAASAPAATWKVEGASLSHGESRNATAALKEGTGLTLTGTILGQHFHITFTSLFSTGWSGGSGSINQSGTIAKLILRYIFSSIHIHTPAGCTVTSPFETKNLTAEVVSHKESETAYVKFFPEEGETLGTIVVKGCAVAGSYPLKGVFYGEGNKFGEEFVNQKLNFSPTINTILGGNVTLGTGPATLTAETTYHLESGSKFGVVK